MPIFDDLLVKVAQGIPLTPQELESFRQEAKTLNEVKTIVKSFVGPDNKISSKYLNLPIEAIYSSVLNEDKPSVTVVIPNAYKHLLIFGAGRTTGAGTSSQYLHCEFSGDSGSNYINQFFTAVAAALTGTRVTGQDHAIIGLLAEGGRPAGDVCSFFSIIPHYNNADLNKNAVAFSTPPFGSFIATASNWDSVGAVTSLTFTPAADSIAAGSIISVYGLL